MVAFIDDLEHAGLVERRRDPRDRRAHNLFLTTAGEKAMAKIAEIGRGWEEELVKSLSSEERVQLRALLERLVADQGITPGVHPGYRAMKPEAS
jgi:DNA-binding MarR family transcriptional regulator